MAYTIKMIHHIFLSFCHFWFTVNSAIVTSAITKFSFKNILYILLLPFIHILILDNRMLVALKVSAISHQ